MGAHLVAHTTVAAITVLPLAAGAAGGDGAVCHLLHADGAVAAGT